MPHTLSRQRLRQTASALFILCVLALAAAFVENLRQPTGQTVTDAETHLKRAKANLRTATSVVTSADRLTQRIGSSNSAVRQTIQSVGQSVIQTLQRENLKASVNVTFARRNAAADHCVQNFNGFNQAQEALATLYLSGIKDAVLRLPGRPGVQGDQSFHKLMVPHDRAVTAVEALHNTQIRELKRIHNVFDGLRMMEKLQEHGLQSTIRPLEMPAQGNTPVRFHVLYVLRADEETARTFLDSSSSASDDKF